MEGGSSTQTEERESKGIEGIWGGVVHDEEKRPAR